MSSAAPSAGWAIVTAWTSSKPVTWSAKTALRMMPGRDVLRWAFAVSEGNVLYLRELVARRCGSPQVPVPPVWSR